MVQRPELYRNRRHHNRYLSDILNIQLQQRRVAQFVLPTRHFRRKERFMKRCSGVLLPIFSLPSPYGIGTLGKAAYDWIDFLHEAGQQLWQVLPIGPTSFGDSPYQSFSAFAGNPYFIDLEQLCEDGLLQKEDCAPLADQADSAAIDYAKQYQYRYAILKKAYSRFDNPNEISVSAKHITG